MAHAWQWQCWASNILVCWERRITRGRSPDTSGEQQRRRRRRQHRGPVHHLKASVVWTWVTLNRLNSYLEWNACLVGPLGFQVRIFVSGGSRGKTLRQHTQKKREEKKRKKERDTETVPAVVYQLEGSCAQQAATGVTHQRRRNWRVCARQGSRAQIIKHARNKRGARWCNEWLLLCTSLMRSRQVGAEKYKQPTVSWGCI